MVIGLLPNKFQLHVVGINMNWTYAQYSTQNHRLLMQDIIHCLTYNANGNYHEK